MYVRKNRVTLIDLIASIQVELTFDVHRVGADTRQNGGDPSGQKGSVGNHPSIDKRMLIIAIESTQVRNTL